MQLTLCHPATTLFSPPTRPLLDLSVAVLRAEDTKSDRDELATLKESLAEYKEDLEELAKADDRIQAPVGSIRLSKRVEKMVANLESNLDEVSGD